MSSGPGSRRVVVRRQAKPLPVRSDGMSNCGLASVYGTFVGVLLAFIIGSAFAPPLLMYTSMTVDGVYSCHDASCSSVSVVRTITGLTPMHEFLQISMSFDKPKAVDGSSKFRALAADFDMLVEVSLSGQQEAGKTLEPIGPSRSHVRHVSCAAGADECSSIVLATENYLTYPIYIVNATLLSPYSAFSESGAVVQPRIVYNMTGLTVNGAATQAEVGIRFFCFTMSFLFFVLFLAALCWRTERRRWTLEQRWSLALLLGAAAFANPLVLAAVYSPGIGWSGVNVFFTVTFVCMLLLFWLVYAHVVVLAGANRVASSANLELSAWLLLPKALFVVLFYGVSLMTGLYLLYKLQDDPAFSLWDESSPGFRQLAFGIGAFLAAVYTVWLTVYIAMGLWYAWSGRLARQFVLFLALTLTAFVAVVAAYYSGALAPVSRETVTTFAFFLAPTFYVWTFAFVNVPGLGKEGGGDFSDAAEAERQVVSSAAASAQGGDDSGILADTLAADEAEQLELELAEAGAGGGVKHQPRRSAAAAADDDGDAFVIDDDDDDDDDDDEQQQQQSRSSEPTV